MLLEVRGTTKNIDEDLKRFLDAVKRTLSLSRTSLTHKFIETLAAIFNKTQYRTASLANVQSLHKPLVFPWLNLPLRRYQFDDKETVETSTTIALKVILKTELQYCFRNKNERAMFYQTDQVYIHIMLGTHLTVTEVTIWKQNIIY